MNPSDEGCYRQARLQDRLSLHFTRLIHRSLITLKPCTQIIEAAGILLAGGSLRQGSLPIVEQTVLANEIKKRISYK